MAYIKVAYINPIRFRPYVSQDSLPRIDKMTNNVDYQRGVYSNKIYKPNWLINETIVVQMQTTIIDWESFKLNAVTPSGVVVVDPTFATLDTYPIYPQIINFSYTPTEEGEYYFYTTMSGESVDEHYISDVIYVKPNDNDLIELQYYDYDNRYSGVFYGLPRYGDEGDEQLIWTPKTYYPGIYKPTIINDYTLYKSDPGEIRKQRAEPQYGFELTLTDVSFLELKKINTIFSCDTLFFNSQPIQNPEIPAPSDIDKNDLIDITINLNQIENDGFAKNY